MTLDKERKKHENDYGHDENQWGLKDDYEKIEWEEHYESRSKKWRTENEQNG